MGPIFDEVVCFRAFGIYFFDPPCTTDTIIRAYAHLPPVLITPVLVVLLAYSLYSLALFLYRR